MELIIFKFLTVWFLFCALLVRYAEPISKIVEIYPSEKFYKARPRILVLTWGMTFICAGCMVTLVI